MQLKPVKMCLREKHHNTTGFWYYYHNLRRISTRIRCVSVVTYPGAYLSGTLNLLVGLSTIYIAFPSPDTKTFTVLLSFQTSYTIEPAHICYLSTNPSS